MWEAIKYVGSGLTLIAFALAIAFAAYRQRILRDERLIKAASEDDRAELIKDALEFFRVDTSRLTKAQQYEIALQQIRSRGTRFQISALVIITLALLLAAISSYAIYEKSSRIEGHKGVPTLLSDLAARDPISNASAEYRGSSVQLFERGWMIANFDKDTLFAIGSKNGRDLKWIKKSESGFIKGIPVKGDGEPGDDELILGFRWFYFNTRNSDVKQLLGRPLTGEIRAWLQFQRFNNGLVVYGLPSTVNGYIDGQFQVLTGVILYGESHENNGVGRAVKLSEANIRGTIYCSANWYPANKNRALPSILRHLIDMGQCDSARGAEVFTSAHSQILIK